MIGLKHDYISWSNSEVIYRIFSIYMLLLFFSGKGKTPLPDYVIKEMVDASILFVARKLD